MTDTDEHETGRKKREMQFVLDKLRRNEDLDETDIPNLLSALKNYGAKIARLRERLEQAERALKVRREMVESTGEYADQLVEENERLREALAEWSCDCEAYHLLSADPTDHNENCLYHEALEALDRDEGGERNTTGPATDPRKRDPYGHDMTHGRSEEGYGVCTCGARENTDESVETCPDRPAHTDAPTDEADAPEEEQTHPNPHGKWCSCLACFLDKPLRGDEDHSVEIGGPRLDLQQQTIQCDPITARRTSDNKPLFYIHRDGRMELAEGVEPTEAAEAMVEHINEMLRSTPEDEEMTPEERLAEIRELLKPPPTSRGIDPPTTPPVSRLERMWELTDPWDGEGHAVDAPGREEQTNDELADVLEECGRHQRFGGIAGAHAEAARRLRGGNNGS